MFLQTTHPELKSSLNITTGATVYFVNLTCNNYGGAVFGDYATMHIAAKARVVFMNNSADFLGGAVSIQDGMITVGVESCMTFIYNNALSGGALRLINSTIHVNTNGMEFYCNNNKAMKFGGAMVLF